ncbi:MAG: DNA repair protein RecO [Gammaproteobacteria bacterium]|nr:DNA repair protein RecO [Gammaproteobacteria bacterium]NIR85698.1 DNA repair protein RecO [Gammaproteobacteria bacterium]NIR90231.1 DNA repair protein RecO [Gammaproteobacteria bacterium]NIU06832.1 DNA repair protein RecO [Gammaproteobacteria bacterium]NIV53765.1 DNA repair protein RecO [Gammaproteobacteria bacterium]
MTSRRVELARAFVLHRRPYRESSVLVEAFSADHGRVGLVARGARRPSSRLRGVLQPFRPLLLSWSGRGELATLTAAECEGVVPMLAGGKLASGFYLNELLLRLLLRHDPHPELFETYRRVLPRLAVTDAHEPVLRVFEKRLLATIGYGLVLDHEADSGHAIDPAALYRYYSEQGPVAQTGEDAPGVPVHGRTLIALDREELDDPEVLHEAKRLMRNVLTVYLGSKPLASRALFR